MPAKPAFQQARGAIRHISKGGFMIKAVTIAGALLSLFPSIVHAHGWVVSPPSRQQFCAAGQAGFDCGDIRWEPQSVEAPKGSQKCSGGGRFGVLDSNANWPVTYTGRDVNFTWKLTAPHRTSTWDYFVDGQLVDSFDQGNQVPPYSVTHTVVGLPTGRHTVLAVWNIGDTINAFYNCVDLVIN
jgi:predicted carbohydrate-binding protein with CBM5 and CBM33 domain